MLLFAALINGCTKGDEGVDDITEDDLYVLYKGIKDSDGKLHEFIYHKDEIYDVRVLPSVKIGDEIMLK
ncbi:MAG: MoaD/ThiS family protein [Chloroflexia bacterium]|nr:MoaD/ThiS family protein [Chloroflexia bacterium]